MTQPAKVQEPSMEEILASIRRIIADDEAKPAVVEQAAPPPRPEPPKVVAPAPKPAAMTNIPPSAIPAAQAAAAKAAPPPAPKPAPPPIPEPAATNSQDDIDAMLAGLDAATTEEEIRPPLPDGDVFELTDDMALPDPEPAPSFQHVEPDDDLEFAEAVAASNERPRAPMFDPPSYDAPPLPPQQNILSHTTVSAVESAFHTLANTVLSNNARTLEDLVKEMLRPMLKSWLDDNLPGLVERIVKAEIERVSRGGR
ncbi:cell pole-organizing protein PopZ [Nitrobacteraceae bacterium AZCC 2161]